MIKVIDNPNFARDGMHCIRSPSPSALEACAICNDKFRMEQIAKGINGSDYESSADAECGKAIHKACAVLLSLLCRKESSDTEYTQLSLYEKSLDSLSKIASWDNSYCEWKFNVEKLKEHYGADYERKLGQFVVRTAGNVVIKMRERGHDVEHR